MPSLSQMEYVVAVARERHFGRAAEFCHISQPTLSQQIQKVEEIVGFPIFDRSKKPVVPTPEGEKFLRQALVILREHKRLREIMRSQNGELAGPLRLAIIPTVAASLVPLFIRKFSAAYPKVELFIEEMKTETILEELQQDRLDVAIMATPTHQKCVSETPLYYEPFELYLAKGHSLLKKKQLGQEDLDGSEMWLLKDGHCFKDQVVRFCSISPKDDSVLRNVHFQSGSLDTLRALVADGVGYTMIPSLMSRQLSEAERKRHVRAFRAPAPAREVSLVCRRDQWKESLVKALRESVLAALPGEVKRHKDRSVSVLEIC